MRSHLLYNVITFILSIPGICLPELAPFPLAQYTSYAGLKAFLMPRCLTRHYIRADPRKRRKYFEIGREKPPRYTLIFSCKGLLMVVYIKSVAEVAELVDAQDSGSCEGFLVLVRFQSSAPRKSGLTVNSASPFCLHCCDLAVLFEWPPVSIHIPGLEIFDTLS